MLEAAAWLSTAGSVLEPADRTGVRRLDPPLRHPGGTGAAGAPGRADGRVAPPAKCARALRCRASQC